MVLSTCGTVVGITKLCGEPAYFRYVGIKAVILGETEAQWAARGRVVVDQCMDHARETFTRMEPALRDHSAQMRCLVFTRLTIHCNSCKSFFRMEPMSPTMHRQPGRHCPNCGEASLAAFDPTLDYWEILAQAIPGDIPPKLLQTIHALWVKDRTATAKFIDYVTSIQQELEDET